MSNITIEGLQVQYIVTKRNNWGQDISYFKLLDGFKPRVKPLYKVNKEEGGKLKIPIWESDAKEVNERKDYMFKVTKKYVNNHEMLIEKDFYTLYCDFEYFEIASTLGRFPCDSLENPAVLAAGPRSLMEDYMRVEWDEFYSVCGDGWWAG